MKYGFIIPRGDVHTIPELAEKVEAAGWDAVFIPDCISIETEQYPATEGFDPWIVLAVIAVRYDGLLPNKLDEDGRLVEITPDDIRAMKTYIEEHRTLETPFAIVWEGRTPGENREKAAAIVREWENAGINWWLEAMWESD